MIKLRLLITLFTFLFLASGCSSQTKIEKNETAQSIQELQRQIENVLNERNVPGLSIAIVNREGPIWLAGLGKADLISNRQATADTLFRIGSVSKGFVSLAILVLVEEGKLSLEDSLQKLAPEVWFENRWESSDPVRLVHLLENTTGWDDLHLCEWTKDSSSLSTLNRLNEKHCSRISRWRPGTRMAYCNSGPAVAAYLVEKISGISFEKYVEQKFFKPIGMQTATYYEPSSEKLATLYHQDGKTAYPYLHLPYHAIGSINASANEMANYLLFYLNRGLREGKQVIPSSLFDRMETSSSTWSAKEGLQVGYGLSNFCTVRDGFVYHGHDGNLPGGLTALQYLSKEGVGYFISINSSNREALEKIDALIRVYLTKDLQKPLSPLTVSLSETAMTYAGWYQPDSPRMEIFSFLERLFGLTHVHFENNALLVTSLGKQKAAFIPVTDTQFRYIGMNEPQDPVATLQLLKPIREEKLIQVSLGLRDPSLLHLTLKQIPTWLAIVEMSLVGFVLLAFFSTLIDAPFWMIRKLAKQSVHNVGVRLWPFLAVLSLFGIILICALSTEDFIPRLGNLTVWSISLYLMTLLLAFTTVASVIALWRASKSELGKFTRFHAFMVTTALVITTIYLVYWGIIGLRTWA